MRQPTAILLLPGLNRKSASPRRIGIVIIVGA
jgi:hypothetical protein